MQKNGASLPQLVPLGSGTRLSIGLASASPAANLFIFLSIYDDQFILIACYALYRIVPYSLINSFIIPYAGMAYLVPRSLGEKSSKRNRSTL